MYKEIHRINNKFRIVLIVRGEYDQNYNGIFNYTGDILLFKLEMVHICSLYYFSYFYLIKQG